ncbi:MAG: hypothetical protein A2W17_01055 [Planctomycetes bacterium RBG_16_41_13]|nr:MAG: hypothetical protein A2W17_01055 [Planctomycetes bacterium RBG_16_41_13]
MMVVPVILKYVHSLEVITRPNMPPKFMDKRDCLKVHTASVKSGDKVKIKRKAPNNFTQKYFIVPPKKNCKLNHPRIITITYEALPKVSMAYPEICAPAIPQILAIGMLGG